MITVAENRSPSIKPLAAYALDIDSDSVKFSEYSAIVSSVIGILINVVVSPGRNVTVFRLESKSMPSPITSNTHNTVKDITHLQHYFQLK